MKDFNWIEANHRPDQGRCYRTPNALWEEAIREANFQRRASGHPNVCPLLDMERFGFSIKLILEFPLAAINLSDYLREHPELFRSTDMDKKEGFSRAVIAQVVEAEAHLNANGIAHRDLKEVSQREFQNVRQTHSPCFS